MLLLLASTSQLLLVLLLVVVADCFICCCRWLYLLLQIALSFFAAAYVLFVSIVLKALDLRFAFEQRSTVLTVAILAITNKDVSYI